jgi:membrane fusion protein, heavy metal efflux system
MPPTAAHSLPPKKSLGRRLRAAIPTLVIIAMLGGIAVWGHSTDWTLPKFSALMSGATRNAVQCGPGEEGWCEEHNVPEAECIECNPKLLPAEVNYGWCAEHGIAQCPLDHPDVAQLKDPPTVAASERGQAERALALLPRPENNSRCKHYLQHIQFASQEAMDKAGIDIAVAEKAPIVEALSANGEVSYDQTHLAHLAGRVPGTVWRVEKQLGDAVRQGEILALIESSDVGHAKAELLAAIAELRIQQTNVQRLDPLANSGAVPGKQLREAEAALQSAQIKLIAAQQFLANLGLPVNPDEFAGQSTEQIAKQIQFLGLPPTLAQSISALTATSNLLPLRSPLDGLVVDCKVVAGESIDASGTIFSVADIRRMWLILDIRQEDAGHLALGQPVLFSPTDNHSQPEIKGTIGWISTAADDKTRTVKIRVDLPNTDGHLRANTFGAGRIVLRDEPQATVVPTEAVHTDGDCHIVFVRDKNFFQEGSPKFFHIREVRLGAQSGDTTEIIAGLLPGEVIASKNSMVLEAQLLKGNLGEGCACCSAGKKEKD